MEHNTPPLPSHILEHTLPHTNIPFTDTHCHLSLLHAQSPQLFSEVLEAQKTEDLFLLDIGINPKDLEQRQLLCKQFKHIYHTIGMHPCESPNYTPNTLQDILEPAIPSSIAIGEIGLDWYRMYAEKTQQTSLFRLQVSLAKQYHKPIIIHARDSLDDILDIVEEMQLHHSNPDNIGIMHCFSGNKAQAKRCLDMGFMISFAANISYTSSLEMREAALYVPDSALLTETDSPYLLHKAVQKIIKKNKKRSNEKSKKKYSRENSPLYLFYLLQTLASIRNDTIEHIALIARKNILQLLQISHPTNHH